MNTMSDDLISRKSVMDIIQDELNLRIGYDADIVLFSVKKRVSELPTANDVYKVVDELEKASKWVNETNEYCDDDGNDYIPLSKAIEIVKQGCVADDVCEWKLEDEESNLYATGCEQKHLVFYETPKENGYKFCPYCGKKIKVVE